MEALSEWLVSDFPDTLKLARELGPIFVALIAAAIAYLIQWRQWKTAERQRQIALEKLKFDLYEKRFDIYLATRDFLASVVREANLDEMALREYAIKTWHSRFLFNESTVTYLENLRHTSVRIGAFKRSYEQNLKNPDRSKMIDENTKDLIWISDQLGKLEQAFLPYLDFSRLK